MADAQATAVDGGMARALSPAKRQGVDAGHLRVSERLLAQLQHALRRAKRYRHVSARLDGVTVADTLGSAWLVDAASSGIAWSPAYETEPAAHERLKKELQDITNLPMNQRELSDTRSEALFVPLRDVGKAKAITHSADRGIELELLSGSRLEMVFMPGAHASPAHRDEFLAQIQEKLTTAASIDSPMTGENATTAVANSNNSSKEISSVVSSSAASIREGPSKTEAIASLGSHDNAPPPRIVDVTTPSDRISSNAEPTPTTKKEDIRRMVRRYTQLDELSDEGIRIATQVQERTGYHLGPTSTQLPSFSSDKAYRKKTVIQLAEFLKRMNVEWSQADAHRQQHTKASHSRNEDELFEYTDTGSGAQISPQMYERRYLDYAKAHDIQPVLHLCPVPEGLASEQVETASTRAAVATGSTSTASSVKTKDQETKDAAAAGFLSILGVDVSSSCVIDHEFFASGASSISQGQHSSIQDDVQRSAVDHAHARIWEAWGVAFAQLRGEPSTSVKACTTDEQALLVHGQALEQHGVSSVPRSTLSSGTSRDNQCGQVHGLLASQSSATRKRTRSRRQDLVQGSALSAVEDPESNQEDSASGCTEDSLDPNGSTPTHVKRERPSSFEPDTAPTSRRKSRRQSIVGVLTLPLTTLERSQDEHKDVEKSSYEANGAPR